MPKEERKMPGPKRLKTIEKPKDFKKAISRLFKELSLYKKLLSIACLLAMLSSIITIISPNKLSNLTDEISKGLVVNEKSIKNLTKETMSRLSEESMKELYARVIEISIDEETINEIMSDTTISDTSKNDFKKAIDNSSIKDIPEDILNKLLKDSHYDNTIIKVEDKIKLIKMTDVNELPDKFIEIVFTDLYIDKIKISPKEQYKFVKIISTLDKNTSPKQIYSKIDKMPSSIQKAIKPNMNLDKIKLLFIVLLIFYLVSSAFSYTQGIIMASLSNGFAKDLRKRISNKINTLPLKYFDRHLSGDILSRVTNDVDTIAQTMNQSLASLVSNITLFLGTLIMMFVTNTILAFTAITSSIIGFLLMSMILKNSQKYFKERQTELGNLNGHIEQTYSGLNVVKAYNGGEEADKKFNEYNKKVCESNKKSQFISGLMQPIMMFIGNFGYVSVCIVGALLTVNGNITFGVIVAFITYVRLFTQPLSQIAQGLTSMQSASAASERVFELLDEPSMEKEEDKITLNKEKVKGNIDFENVSFKYDGSDKPTITNFSVKVKAGQKIAIVGPTGAGKTTMVNLLMKFYEIDDGEIKIDGVSTKDLTRENIHDLFTMVLQDTWLFEGTIKENIVFSRKNIEDKDIKHICEEVGLDHFIKTLPKGYDTNIEDNDSVSAGQRQLLTIARAMMEHSPFLILDEATSNVDTRTEELVAKAMDKLAKGKTSFIIAHRLSTIKNADLILVMDAGSIIEFGTHEELMKKNGFYTNLYNAQFEK